MNVNSRGHNLDTKWSHLFPEIKHPPGLKNPVGVFPSSDLRKYNQKVLICPLTYWPFRELISASGARRIWRVACKR
jgi:hypothetical protein